MDEPDFAFMGLFVLGFKKAVLPRQPIRPDFPSSGRKEEREAHPRDAGFVRGSRRCGRQQETRTVFIVHISKQRLEPRIRKVPVIGERPL